MFDLSVWYGSATVWLMIPDDHGVPAISQAGEMTSRTRRAVSSWTSLA